MMFDSARLKVERASEQIDEILAMSEISPPFTYVLETDTMTGDRATFSELNHISLKKLVIRCGEVFHNLRSALDHAYWEAVVPYIEDENKHGAIQFPFAKDSLKLEQAIKSRLAHQVSEEFFNLILSFKPCNGSGGNQLLSLLHEVNILDKHKFPTPVGDFTQISSADIRAQVPDFPAGLTNVGFGGCRRDVVWRTSSIDPKELGEIVPPTTCIFRRQLSVPVGIVLNMATIDYTESLITTLTKMRTEVQSILTQMSKSELYPSHTKT
ncbi:hypothetical protein CGH05_24340 [Vibrio parahaemolyticus]|nr:hypothetical protein CGH05_24340 [Vibrio parahaemolyticus]